MRYRMTDNELRNGQPGTLGLIAGYGYDYDSIGNVTHLRDKKEEDDYQRRFTYDELKRLLRASTKADTPAHPSPLWGEAGYSWDAMGNILRASLAEVEPGGPDNLARTNPKRFQPPNKPIKRSPNTIVQPLGRVMSFTYEGTTPVMTAITLNDLSRPVAHDTAGNEVSYVVKRSYSPRNLLGEVIDDSDPGELWPHEVAYAYDGRGVRVVRAENPSNGGGTVARRSYVYTRELQLLSVTREDGMNVWGGNPPSSFGNNVDEEIVWFGSRPVAQIAPAGATRYTFADHLGTPLLQTDSTGTIIWRVEYEPFGNVFIVREGTRTDQPLRFPGQELAMTWEGPEENYNIFRWYKSSSGRYTQADPMGLVGGPNLFAYALANPVRVSDPYGLFAELLCRQVNVSGLKGWQKAVVSAYKPVHCRLRVSCGCPPTGFDTTVGRENVNPKGSPGIYALTQDPYSKTAYGLPWTPYPVGGTGTDCVFEKCVLKAFQAQQSHPGLVPPYNALGPNSNTYVHDLIKQ